MKYGNIENPKEIDNLWEVVEDSGELSSAVTTYTFSNLTGDTDVEYKLICRFVGIGTSTTYYLQPNADTTTSNYGYQRIRGTSTTADASRATTTTGMILGNAPANYVGFSETTLYAKSGQERTGITLTTDMNGTTVTDITQYDTVWSNTANEITSLVVRSTTASAIGIGSRLILLKRTNITSGVKTGTIDPQGTIYGVWEKIDEHEVTGSAETSHTFSSLTGNTDVLYKIIFRGVQGHSGSSTYAIRPNNDSGTNYGDQYLYGSNATVSAARNTARNRIAMGSISTLNYLMQSEVLIYAKSGYERTVLVKSSYDITGTTVNNAILYGTSWNNTADEITSLVVYGDDTSALGVGTHIELWRLNL